MQIFRSKIMKIKFIHYHNRYYSSAHTIRYGLDIDIDIDIDFDCPSENRSSDP